jgi:hypothetical protein
MLKEEQLWFLQHVCKAALFYTINHTRDAIEFFHSALPRPAISTKIYTYFSFNS